MKRTFKFRIFPTKSQKVILGNTLESCRLVYNKILETRKNGWEQEKKSISNYDTIKMLPIWKEEIPFLCDVYAQVLQNVSNRVDFAFQSFFRRVRDGDKPGYPRFKSFSRYDSFTYPQGGFKLKDKLYLSKIGGIKIKSHRLLKGKIKTLVIQKDKVGNWYACFLCEIEPEPLPISWEIVGIDLGLTKFATFSNGEVIKRERWMKHDEKDIKRIQRKMSKLDKGISERKKVVKALNHAHMRIKNRRANFAHQESRKLVNRFGLIVFEKLNIKDMQSDNLRTINKGIADVAWNQFINFTSYKAEEAGRSVVLVDPKNTTQQCSKCGSIVKKDLSIRVHDCPGCGLKIDRDLNASLNILARGLASLRLRPIETLDLSNE